MLSTVFVSTVIKSLTIQTERIALLCKWLCVNQRALGQGGFWTYHDRPLSLSFPEFRIILLQQSQYMNELKNFIFEIPFHWPLIVISFALLGLVSILFIGSSKCREEQNTWANLISWIQLKCLHQFPYSDVFSGSVFPSQLVKKSLTDQFFRC